MYGQQQQQQPTFPRSSYEFLTYYLTTSPDGMSSPLDSVSDAIHSSSGSYSSPSCCCTPKPSYSQLPKNEPHCRFVASFIDSDSCPVRRVFSAGDLHSGRRSESPSSYESDATAIIEGMNRAWPYSPEEKKERIQRYRTKRNLRNFNKKIKYACRKTLADSRPRIRGRFIRNTEIDHPKIPQLEWNQIHGEDGDDDDEMNWIGFLDIHS